MTRDQIEEIKERLTDQYERDIVNLYRNELRSIFIWFKKKFPKRKLRWISGMGTFCWELDGKLLHWESVVPTYASHCYQTGWKEAKPDRKEKVLLPMWEFYMSISDTTNYLGRWIDAGDFTMEML